MPVKRRKTPFEKIMPCTTSLRYPALYKVESRYSSHKVCYNIYVARETWETQSPRTDTEKTVFNKKNKVCDKNDLLAV